MGPESTSDDNRLIEPPCVQLLAKFSAPSIIPVLTCKGFASEWVIDVLCHDSD